MDQTTPVNDCETEATAQFNSGAADPQHTRPYRETTSPPPTVESPRKTVRSMSSVR